MGLIDGVKFKLLLRMVMLLLQLNSQALLLYFEFGHQVANSCCFSRTT